MRLMDVCKNDNISADIVKFSSVSGVCSDWLVEVSWKQPVLLSQALPSYIELKNLFIGKCNKNQSACDVRVRDTGEPYLLLLMTISPMQ